jgi:hypothetical protein
MVALDRHPKPPSQWSVRSRVCACLGFGGIFRGWLGSQVQSLFLWVFAVLGEGQTVFQTACEERAMYLTTDM